MCRIIETISINSSSNSSNAILGVLILLVITSTFYVHYIILYNILISTDGAVRRMFLSFHLFWTSDYTFRYNIWTTADTFNMPASYQ